MQLLPPSRWGITSPMPLLRSSRLAALCLPAGTGIRILLFCFTQHLGHLAILCCCFPRGGSENNNLMLLRVCPLARGALEVQCGLLASYKMDAIAFSRCFQNRWRHQQSFAALPRPFFSGGSVSSLALPLPTRSLVGALQSCAVAPLSLHPLHKGAFHSCSATSPTVLTLYMLRPSAAYLLTLCRLLPDFLQTSCLCVISCSVHPCSDRNTS